MAEFPPTPEQLAIVDFVRSSQSNLMVRALAGAAKTSTLVLIANSVRGIPMLSVAFNKRIAVELSERLPSTCVCKTMNSIGHTAWATFIGRKIVLSDDKLRTILQSLVLSRGEKEALSEIFMDIVQLAHKAKVYGYIPYASNWPTAQPLFNRAEFESLMAEYEYDPVAWELLDPLLSESIRMAFSGEIDFADQLYMPTLFGAQFPRFPFVMIDEAQDLSPLNHRMLQKLVTKRVIAVGDPNQAIYGFRGAVANSMDMLKTQFKMEELGLTVCFRCAQSIVKEATCRAPEIKAWDQSPKGQVWDWQDPDLVWGPEIFPPKCAIICRNNGPLIALGLRLMRAGKPVKLIGFDISKRLIKILREFGDTSMERPEVQSNIRLWRERALTEDKLSESSIEDRYQCLMAFADMARTLSETITRAEALFAAEGSIELLSGHKAKGLEWEKVFYLDPWRIPAKYAKTDEEKQQEYNIDYVIVTRAQRELFYINLDSYDPEETSTVAILPTEDNSK